MYSPHTALHQSSLPFDSIHSAEEPTRIMANALRNSFRSLTLKKTTTFTVLSIVPKTFPHAWTRFLTTESHLSDRAVNTGAFGRAGTTQTRNNNNNSSSNSHHKGPNRASGASGGSGHPQEKKNRPWVPEDDPKLFRIFFRSPDKIRSLEDAQVFINHIKSSYGALTQYQFSRCPETKRYLGYGFLTFKTESSMTQALKDGYIRVGKKDFELKRTGAMPNRRTVHHRNTGFNGFYDLEVLRAKKEAAAVLAEGPVEADALGSNAQVDVEKTGGFVSALNTSIATSPTSATSSPSSSSSPPSSSEPAEASTPETITETRLSTSEPSSVSTSTSTSSSSTSSTSSSSTSPTKPVQLHKKGPSQLWKTPQPWKAGATTEQKDGEEANMQETTSQKSPSEMAAEMVQDILEQPTSSSSSSSSSDDTTPRS